MSVALYNDFGWRWRISEQEKSCGMMISRMFEE
jgi:hypothetical protein